MLKKKDAIPDKPTDGDTVCGENNPLKGYFHREFPKKLNNKIKHIFLLNNVKTTCLFIFLHAKLDKLHK